MRRASWILRMLEASLQCRLMLVDALPPSTPLFNLISRWLWMPLLTWFWLWDLVRSKLLVVFYINRGCSVQVLLFSFLHSQRFTLHVCSGYSSHSALWKALSSGEVQNRRSALAAALLSVGKDHLDVYQLLSSARHPRVSKESFTANILLLLLVYAQFVFCGWMGWIHNL